MVKGGAKSAKKSEEDVVTERVMPAVVVLGTENDDKGIDVGKDCRE